MGARNQSRPSRQRAAFTLIELLIVVAVIALLLSILLPALSQARQSTLRVTCQSNLRQQLQGTMMYASEYKDALPVAKNYDWEQTRYTKLVHANYIQEALIPYLGGQKRADIPVDPAQFKIVAFAKVFRCPAVERNPKDVWVNSTEQNHYRYNTHKAIDQTTGAGRAIGTIRYTARAVLYYDVAFADWKPPQFPHDQPQLGLNVGYVDSHVDFMSAKAYLKASPRAPYAQEWTNAFIANGWDEYAIKETSN